MPSAMVRITAAAKPRFLQQPPERRAQILHQRCPCVSLSQASGLRAQGSARSSSSRSKVLPESPEP